MRAKLTLLSALVLGTFGGVLATGCQTYDFEPVEPLAISQTTATRHVEALAAKPNLMLLVDTSGSMTEPVDKDLQNSSGTYLCRKGGTSLGEVCGTSTACNTTQCPTRWSDLQAAMVDFLSSGAIARIGLATYPDLSAGDSCGASASLSVDLPPADKDDDATLSANAVLVKNKLLAIKNSSTSGEPTPRGGTPTSLSLQYVGSRPELQTAERSDFVLLLTDGLPNCNKTYPNPSPDARCFCTLGTAVDSCKFATQIGCLDKDASVTAVESLRSKEIQTIVIGFGADFNTASTSGAKGAETLTAMADAGGFALKRSCTKDADCGTGDGCDTSLGLCKRRFYQAANRTDLVTALREISEKVKVDKPCEITFAEADRPSSDELVVVYINDERLSPGPDTWSLTATGILFTGSTCARIESSTTTSPVDIEVRAVQRR